MDSRSTISEQLNTAVDEGNMENIRAILNQKDQNGLTDDDILFAQCILGYSPGIYQQFEQPIEACHVLYEGLSESGKEMRLPSSTERTGWSPLHSAGFYGRKSIVKFLVEKGYDVNRRDEYGQSPLQVAAAPFTHGGDDFEICKMLLENGALPNAVNIHGRTPLDGAVHCFKTDVIRLLLEEYHVTPTQKAIDTAIMCFRAEILSLLLQHGGRVEYDSSPHVDDGTNLEPHSLRPDFEHEEEEDGEGVGDEDDEDDGDGDEDGDLIPRRRTPLNEDFMRRGGRYRLLNICRILVNHARKNIDDTTAFLLASIVNEDDKQSCKDYIDAGVDKHLALRQVVQDNKESVCKWLVELGADPFLVNTNDTWSPFQLAASLDDMSILRYFLNLWIERFLASNTGGNKNRHSDSRIHVLCRYPHVSLQAIKLLVEEFEANVSQAVVAATVASAGSGHATLLPFHLAVMSDVKLDVLYYLLRLHPDALTETTTI